MTATASVTSSRRASRLMWWGAAGAGLLMVAGGAAFYLASLKAASNASAAGEAVTVTLRDGACQPNAMTVPAGRSTFRVVNATDRVVEWEILDGVMVLEERENIAPGFTQTMGARLRAGKYAITCGLLSNPRGTLTVTPSAVSGDAERPALVAFVGPLAEYQVFLAMQANELVKATKALDEAIRAGDLDGARALYTAARLPYLRVAPVASRFADLDNAIDPVAAYLEKREEDPAFTGFHRIEYGLFGKGSIEGLAPVSTRLAAGASAVKDRLRATRLTPDDMGSGAVRLLTALADTRVPTGENFYAGTDLADFEAEVAGVRKIVMLLKPVAERTAPDEVKEVETRMAALDARLASLRGPEGFPAFDTLEVGDRTGLADEMRAAADAIGRMNDVVGFGEDGAS